jgi:hypothetical protein
MARWELGRRVRNKIENNFKKILHMQLRHMGHPSPGKPRNDPGHLERTLHD